MASLPQNCLPLSASLCPNKNLSTSYIVQLGNNRHSRHLVACNQISEPTFSPLALREQKKHVGCNRKQWKQEKWKAWCSDDGSCGVAPQFLPLPSAVEVVNRFYIAFNAKDTQELEQLLSPNVVYQDLVLYGHFEGKENVMNFLHAAMDALGSSIQLVVDEVSGADHLTATSSLHLEWKDKKIPFTHGYRFFKFEQDEGRLLISTITGVEELPIKPGDLALKLVKAVGILFDRYPFAAEALLNSYASQEKHEGPDLHFDWFGRKF